MSNHEFVKFRVSKLVESRKNSKKYTVLLETNDPLEAFEEYLSRYQDDGIELTAKHADGVWYKL